MDYLQQVIHNTLVARSQVGEFAALQELFLRHNPSLVYYLRGMLKRDDVDDIQQDVWLRVVRRIGRLRNPESFTVWLYQIARHRVADRLGDRPAALPLDEIGVIELTDSPEPEPPLSTHNAAQVHGGLASLSPEHREVLVLRFLEDLSYEHIADIVGCTIGTVRSRLHYAKLALREHLEAQS